MGRPKLQPWPPETISARIRARLVEGPGGCLLWTGARDPRGYGRVGFEGYSKLVHRALWTAEKGPIPQHLPLDHLCRVTACANVDEHLEVVTQSVNLQRAVPHHDNWGAAARARRVYTLAAACKAGHEFTPENTRVDSTGHRHCRSCDEAARDRRTEARRLARIEVYGYDPGPTARHALGAGGSTR